MTSRLYDMEPRMLARMADMKDVTIYDASVIAKCLHTYKLLSNDSHRNRASGHDLKDLDCGRRSTVPARATQDSSAISSALPKVQDVPSNVDLINAMAAHLSSQS